MILNIISTVPDDSKLLLLTAIMAGMYYNRDASYCWNVFGSVPNELWCICFEFLCRILIVWLALSFSLQCHLSQFWVYPCIASPLSLSVCYHWYFIGMELNNNYHYLMLTKYQALSKCLAYINSFNLYELINMLCKLKVNWSYKTS